MLHHPAVHLSVLPLLLRVMCDLLIMLLLDTLLVLQHRTLQPEDFGVEKLLLREVLCGCGVG